MELTDLVRLVLPIAASRSPGWPFSAVQMGQAYFFRLLAAPCTHLVAEYSHTYRRWQLQAVIQLCVGQSRPGKTWMCPGWVEERDVLIHEKGQREGQGLGHHTWDRPTHFTWYHSWHESHSIMEVSTL